jgi:hypothetical protein
VHFLCQKISEEWLYTGQVVPLMVGVLESWNDGLVFMNKVKENSALDEAQRENLNLIGCRIFKAFRGCAIEAFLILE